MTQQNNKGTIRVAAGEEVPDPRIPVQKPIDGSRQPMTKSTDLGDALIKLTNPETGDDYEMPELSMRSLLLLERIDSPFVRDSVPVVAPNGEPVMDPVTKRPVMQGHTPTLEEVARSFFILLKQDQPNILAIIKDSDGFDNIILEFASQLTPLAMKRICTQMNEKMARVNAAAEALGTDEAGSKKEDGPTESSEHCSQPVAEAPTESKNG